MDKKNPRSWSNRYWSKNHISKILKEVTEPENVDVSSIKMNDELSPLIWDGEKMKTDVRKTLLLNAKRFIEFSDLQDLTFNDIILTGSMCNYNYYDNSDLDVHILLDLTQISSNIDFVGDYLKMKKLLWSNDLPIQIKGHDVELYFQDINEPHHSTGTYSIMKDNWIRKPLKKIINIDTANVQLKSADIMNAIDDLESNKNSKDFINRHDNLKNKIKNLRQSGLDKSGEFSTENLVFKILRNNGYLEKMVELKNKYLTKELSLDEFLNPDL